MISYQNEWEHGDRPRIQVFGHNPFVFNNLHFPDTPRYSQATQGKENCEFP